jgi:hypothetical protein
MQKPRLADGDPTARRQSRRYAMYTLALAITALKMQQASGQELQQRCYKMITFLIEIQ